MIVGGVNAVMTALVNGAHQAREVRDIILHCGRVQFKKTLFHRRVQLPEADQFFQGAGGDGAGNYGFALQGLAILAGGLRDLHHQVAFNRALAGQTDSRGVILILEASLVGFN